jgi:hypothetical protein
MAKQAEEKPDDIDPDFLSSKIDRLVSSAKLQIEQQLKDGASAPCSRGQFAERIRASSNRAPSEPSVRSQRLAEPQGVSYVRVPLR